MQYGHGLDHLLREIVYTYPALGPVYILKADVSNGFCRILLWHSESPKLELVSLTAEEDEPILVIPLTLPMGWKKPPPTFCMATETVVNISNNSLCVLSHTRPHPMYDSAERISIRPQTLLNTTLDATPYNPTLCRNNADL